MLPICWHPAIRIHRNAETASLPVQRGLWALRGGCRHFPNDIEMLYQYQTGRNSALVGSFQYCPAPTSWRGFFSAQTNAAGMRNGRCSGCCPRGRSLRCRWRGDEIFDAAVSRDNRTDSPKRRATATCQGTGQEKPRWHNGSAGRVRFLGGNMPDMTPAHLLYRGTLAGVTHRRERPLQLMPRRWQPESSRLPVSTNSARLRAPVRQL
jgi:hypothetical protein